MNKEQRTFAIIIAVIVIVVGLIVYFVQTGSFSISDQGGVPIQQPASTTTSSGPTDKNPVTKGPTNPTTPTSPIPWWQQWQVGEKVDDFTIASIDASKTFTDPKFGLGVVTFTGSTLVHGHYTIHPEMAGADESAFQVDKADFDKIPNIIPGDDVNGDICIKGNIDTYKKTVISPTKDVTVRIANYIESANGKDAGCREYADFVELVQSAT